MGKIRTRTLGLEEVEVKQKKAQKVRSQEKKSKKSSKEPTDSSIQIEASSKERKSTEETPDSKEKKSDVKKSKRGLKVKEAPPKSSIRGKKYKEALKKIDTNKIYSLSGAVALLKQIKFTSFDESVELHLNLDEPGIRGEVDLPHSIGKTVRVKIADDSVIEAIEKGIIEFDVLISHPSYMPKLVKYAKVLGPRGLMPNPKAGTISTNPEETMKKFTKGVIRWKSEAKFPLLHQMIGKISYKQEDILENARLYLQSVGKPHIRKAFIKTTMSPSIRFDTENL